MRPIMIENTLQIQDRQAVQLLAPGFGREKAAPMQVDGVSIEKAFASSYIVLLEHPIGRARDLAAQRLEAGFDVGG